MDIPRGGQAKPAGELCTEVADNVPEQIAGHDDIELPRIANHLHRQGVYIKVARLDFGVLLPDFLEDALPQIVCKGHGVRLVTHAHSLQPFLPRVVEGMADDALHTFTGIDVLLNRNLVGSPLLKKAAHTDVKPFGVFAE